MQQQNQVTQQPLGPHQNNMIPLVGRGHEEEKLPNQEMKPLGLLPLNTLGEPDPSNITKQDILSAIAFDKQG